MRIRSCLAIVANIAIMASLQSPRAIQVRFPERPEAHAIPRQAIEVLKGFERPLPAEPIECPEEQAIKAALAGILEQRFELIAVARRSCLVIDILPADLPALAGGELPQPP